MNIHWITVAIFLIGLSTALSDDSPRIALIDSATPTAALLAKPGTYLGEKLIFEEDHSGDVPVRIGVWEAGPGKSIITEFPFTE